MEPPQWPRASWRSRSRHMVRRPPRPRRAPLPLRAGNLTSRSSARGCCTHQAPSACSQALSPGRDAAWRCRRNAPSSSYSRRSTAPSPLLAGHMIVLPDLLPLKLPLAPSEVGERNADQRIVAFVASAFQEGVGLWVCDEAVRRSSRSGVSSRACALHARPPSAARTRRVGHVLASAGARRPAPASGITVGNVWKQCAPAEGGGTAVGRSRP